MGEENQNRGKKIKLLTDKPTIHNKFAHEKVAKAISDLIIEEEGGNTIALTGYWGSGKSSIIEMIKTKLKGKVFVFDAWVHEGDPLRRSFLESIINFFLDQTILNKKYWEEKLEELAKRKETTKTEDSIEPTVLGVFLFISTLIVPLGLVLLSLWKNIDWSILILSIILSLLPFGIFLFVGVKYLFEKDADKKKKIISILINQSDKTLTSTTSKTSDPTSIEFQNIFFNLMNEVSLKYEDKFLIVIDNLDRIDTEDALKIWSTMRTFFDFNKVKNDKWLKNTWLLIPYDSSSLKKLWGKESSKDDATGEKDNKHKQYFVNSFTDKTFQITFETPLPIVSDSVKYFEEQLMGAFGESINYDERHKIYRIFDTLRNSEIPTTPREIKLFINTLTATFRQWSNEIPPHIQALYILLRKNAWQDDNKLLKDLRTLENIFFDETLFEIVDKEYREFLASLYFNVQKDKALQILLSKSIETALTKADLPYLTKNQSLPGFSLICENIINLNKWAKEEPNILATVTFSLSSLSLDKDKYLSNAWNKLKRDIKEISNWKTLTKNAANGLCEMIRRENSKEFSENIIIKIVSSELLFADSKASAEETILKSKENIISILEALSKIILQIKQLNHTDILENNFIINSDANIYNEIIFLLTNIESFDQVKEYYKTNSEIEEISKNLASKIIEAKFTDYNWFHAFTVIYNNYSSINLSDIISAISSRLKEQNLDGNEVGVLIYILFLLKNTKEEAKNALNTLTIKGFIPAHFSKSLSNLSSASCLYCMIHWSSNGKLNADAPISSIANKGIQKFINIKTSPLESEVILENYINVLIEFSEIEDIFSLEDINKDFSKLEDELTRLVSKLPNIIEIINVDILIENETQFYNSLESVEKDESSTNDYQTLIERYIKEANLLNVIKIREFDIDLWSLYLAILKSKEVDAEMIEYFKNGLNEITKEQWQEEINNESENAYFLIIGMVKKDFSPKLKTPFLDLLKSKIDLILEDKTIETLISSNWNILINALDQDHKKILLENVRYKLNNTNKDFSKVLYLFGDELFNENIFKPNIDDVVNEGFSKIIDRKNAKELEWLINLFQVSQNMLENCDSSSISVFKEKIINSIKATTNDNVINSLFKNLAKLVNITIEEEEQESEES